MSNKKYLRDIPDSDIVDNIKIKCEDYFELVYMRHRYFRKSKNPAPERIAQFEEMLCNISDKFFVRNYKVFNQTGFELEDLRNIARVHVVSFIHMGGLAENPDKMEKFRQRHEKQYGNDSEPDKMDIFRKECYDLNRFLNQRMQDIVRNCKSKNNNIRGTCDRDLYFIGNPMIEPSDIDLAKYPEVYGYKKISKKQFKILQKENDATNKKSFIDKDNMMVRTICLKGKKLSAGDMKDIGLDPRDNLYYGDPEQNLIKMERENSLYMNFLEQLDIKLQKK